MIGDFFYELNQWLLFVLALGIFYLSAEIGYRYGVRFAHRMSAEAHAHVASVEGALLGLLALLLGFAFAMAISRFDQRREVVVEEANDLQTTYMRSQLLRDPYAAESAQLLREYLDSRISFYQAGTNTKALEASLASTDQLQSRLWQVALRAGRDNSDEVTTGYYIVSLNNLIDDHTKRVAAMSNHVPEVIMHLLFFVAVMTIGVSGYSSGMLRKRLRALRMILITLIAATLVVIIDLDRPRRGFIKVSEGQLVKLRDHLHHFTAQK